MSCFFDSQRITVTEMSHSELDKYIHERFYVQLRIGIASMLRPSVWWLGSRVVSVLDSGAEGSGFKSQSRRCRVTVLGKLFTPIVPLFTKQQNC